MEITTRLFKILYSIITNSDDYKNGELWGYTQDGKDYLWENGNRFYEYLVCEPERFKNILDKELFVNMKLDNEELDKTFKELFISKFIDRNIKYQTFDTFRYKLKARLKYFFKYVNELEQNKNNYLTSKMTGMSHDEGNNTGNVRTASTSLPQNEVNIDLNNNTLQYADVNDISKTSSTALNNRTYSNEYHSLNTLEQYYQIFTLELIRLDNDLFTQIDFS